MSEPEQSSPDPAAVLKSVRAQVRQNWVRAGLLPLVVCAVLVIIVEAAHLGPQGLPEKRVEDTFAAILAISAIVFLIGFGLDGRWTSAERIARDLTEEEAADPPRAAARVAEAIQDATAALTLMGNALSLAAVLAAYAGGGFNQGAQLLVLAACYHFFFLSRHSYYYGLVAAAGEGTLLAPPEAPSDEPPEHPQDGHGDLPDDAACSAP